MISIETGLLLVFLLGAASHAQAQDGSAPPNVVIINADDLGYGDLGCYGAKQVKTPHIDRLASEGRRFLDAHSASAVCSPSRYGLLTGCYPLRRNFWGPTSLRQPLTIDTQRLTLGRLMSEAGYSTACIGKWHLGFGKEEPDWNGELAPGPLELGFDHYFGIPRVNSGPPFVYVEDHHVVGLEADDPFVYGTKSITANFPEKGGYTAIGGAQAAHRLYEDDGIATMLRGKAVEWLLAQDGQKPFFLYLATTNIHHPFTPAPQFIGTSECGLYGDFIHELDWIVGGVLGALESKGALDNTLIIFTSDNGGMLHLTGQKAWKAGHRMNGDLLGFKFGVWEGGHRVPFIVRWPGRVPAGSTSNQLISQIDIMATLAAIVDRTLGEGAGEDSINQLESLVGSPQSALRETLVVTPNSPRHLGIRRGKWMYIPAQGAGGFQGKKPADHLFAGIAALSFAGRSHSDVQEGKLRVDAPAGQLYDLALDPRQTTNVFAQKPAIVAQLARILADYNALIPKTPRVGWINLKQ